MRHSFLIIQLLDYVYIIKRSPTRVGDRSVLVSRLLLVDERAIAVPTAKCICFVYELQLPAHQTE